MKSITKGLCDKLSKEPNLIGYNVAMHKVSCKNEITIDYVGCYNRFNISNSMLGIIVTVTNAEDSRNYVVNSYDDVMNVINNNI